MVLEETDGKYATVLSHIHTTIIYLDADTKAPKAGATLGEEGSSTDQETFLDNFPLFPNEPDSIISQHSYYEDWAYSIYRRQGTTYQWVYTGCGGGV